MPQVKISLSNLFYYFSISGVSKQKKIPTKKVVVLGGATPSPTPIRPSQSTQSELTRVMNSTAPDRVEHTN